MGFLATSLNATGVLFLAHAVYSAYEHSLLPPSTTPSAPTSLPLDIAIETVVSLVLLCAGIVLAAPALRPIQWHEWASAVEKEDGLPLERRRRLVERKIRGLDGGGVVGSPFRGLEERAGFVDVRAKRREFADWVRDGGKAMA